MLVEAVVMETLQVDNLVELEEVEMVVILVKQEQLIQEVVLVEQEQHLTLT